MLHFSKTGDLQKMKFQKQNTPKTGSLDNSPDAMSCPLLSIPEIDEHGMVLESRCGFEVGSTIALGFHLHYAESLSNIGQSETDRTRFISVEAIVIESRLISGSSGQPVHLVTVLFSQISRKDREYLLHFSGCLMAHTRRQLFEAPPCSPSPKEFCEELRREVTQRIHLN